MNWYGNRHNEQFIFRKVSWDNWQEHGTFDYITGGEIEYANDAELKVTSKLSFEGYEVPDANDLIRVYYAFSDNNASDIVPLGTFFVSYATLNYIDTVKGLKASGDINGLSILSVLANRKLGRPFTIKRGTNAIYEAQDLIQAVGLKVQSDSTSFVLTSDYTFDSDDSYLDVVNYLLNVAGYESAYPDEMGVVQLRNMKSEANRIITFANNDESIMYPDVQQDNDWQETPNVVKLLYNTDEACILAEASNINGSRASLESRGNREITYFEEVSNVGEGSVATLLQRKAEDILREKSADIEYVQFENAYIPMSLHDEVTIYYGDLEWSGTLDNFSVELSPSVPTITRVKRSLTQDIIITSFATIYRGNK